jgi:hypothetical protein
VSRERKRQAQLTNKQQEKTQQTLQEKRTAKKEENKHTKF